MLIRDPKLRLGSSERDALELKEHPFFAEIDWVRLGMGQSATPFAPQVAGSLDTSQFDQEFTSMLPAGLSAKFPSFICLLSVCVILGIVSASLSRFLILSVSPDAHGTYFSKSIDRAFEGFTFVDDSASHLLHSAFKIPGVGGGGGVGVIAEMK